MSLEGDADLQPCSQVTRALLYARESDAEPGQDACVARSAGSEEEGEHAIDCKDTEPSGEGSRACEGDSVVSLAAGGSTLSCALCACHAMSGIAFCAARLCLCSAFSSIASVAACFLCVCYAMTCIDTSSARLRVCCAMSGTDTGAPQASKSSASSGSLHQRVRTSSYSRASSSASASIVLAALIVLSLTPSVPAP